jgi:hypothetical protein
VRLGEEGKDILHDTVVYEGQVDVRVTPWQLVRGFVGTHWQWLAGTLLVPGVVWCLKRLLDQRQLRDQGQKGDQD